MKFETMLPLIRKGGKFTKPGMGDRYITIVSVAMNREGTVFADKMILSSPTIGNQTTFSFNNEDVMSEDWIDCEPIVKTHMCIEGYKVRCPSCKAEYSVGPEWELRVGDIHKCTCGNKLLLAPPENCEDNSKIESNNP